MSTKLFTVRSFDPTREGVINATGVIENFTSYNTRKVKSLPKVIVELLRGPEGAFSARGKALAAQSVYPAANLYVRDNGDSARFDPTTVALAALPELQIYQVKVKFGQLIDLKTARSTLVEVLQRWAEKSRVRGLRGWRSNAVKAPTFKRTDTGWEATTTVVLGTLIVYSDQSSTVSISQTDLLNDLKNLKTFLAKMPGYEDDSTKIAVC